MLATIVPERSSSGIASVLCSQEERSPMMNTMPALKPQCEIFMRTSSFPNVRGCEWVVERGENCGGDARLCVGPCSHGGRVGVEVDFGHRGGRWVFCWKESICWSVS